MRNEHLDHLVKKVEGLRAAAWSDRGGAVQARSAGFEGDVPCAVAAICRGQLDDLGKLLGATSVRDWAIATPRMNLYVVEKGNHAMVALGEHDDKPTKVTEEIGALID